MTKLKRLEKTRFERGGFFVGLPSLPIFPTDALSEGMDQEHINAELKLVGLLIDALGYCDPETYDTLFQMVERKLKALARFDHKDIAYLQAHVPQSAKMSSADVDARFNSLIKQSSDAGCAEAQYQYACRLWEQGDFEGAITLYKASADQGYPPSQYCYGLGLRDGVGIRRDQGKGLFYIELSAGRLYDLALEYLIAFYRDNQTAKGKDKSKLYSQMLNWSER